MASGREFFDPDIEARNKVTAKDGVQDVEILLTKATEAINREASRGDEAPKFQRRNTLWR